MKSNNFFEKFGKFIFSIFLTGTIVTGIVYAASWSDLNDNDIVTGTHWQNLVANIGGKVDKSDIPACSTGESLTYDGTAFSCTSPAEVSMPESVQAGTEYNNTFDDKYINVTFPKAFSGPPKVVVAMNGFYLENSSRSEKFELYPSASSVTASGFRLLIPGNTRNNHKLKAASVTWIAIPPTGSWSSPTTSSYSGGCGSKRTVNNEKSGSCLVGLSNTYYTGESTCTYMESRMGRGGEPIVIPRSGYKYTNKKHQTCN